jgi:hypothetical protein
MPGETRQIEGAERPVQIRVRVDQPFERGGTLEDVLEEQTRAICHARSSNSPCMPSSGAHSHDGSQVAA